MPVKEPQKRSPSGFLYRGSILRLSAFKGSRGLLGFRAQGSLIRAPFRVSRGFKVYALTTWTIHARSQTVSRPLPFWVWGLGLRGLRV